MKPISVDEARRLGRKAGAQRLVIITMGEGEDFAITTWGKTRRDCQALAGWAESEKADETMCQIADAGLLPPVRRECEHDFQGWRELAGGRGGERFCSKCGMGSMEHSMRLLP